MDQHIHIDMPKLVDVEIKKIGGVFRVFLRGVLLKRTFDSYEKAVDYLPNLHNYFGDNCGFILKKRA